LAVRAAQSVSGVARRARKREAQQCLVELVPVH
jgi:hypothetical protein